MPTPSEVSGKVMICLRSEKLDLRTLHRTAEQMKEGGTNAARVNVLMFSY